ncbi:hypothetical protein QUC31_008656 [Theobroma cacao]
MHRSSSGSRVADEFFINSTPSESQSSKQQSSETVSLIPQQLPTYNPLSYAAKKERSRIRFAENAIHIIPLVLILCAIILWFFSSPGFQYHPFLYLFFVRLRPKVNSWLPKIWVLYNFFSFI